MPITAAQTLHIYRSLYDDVSLRLQSALPGGSLPMTCSAFLYTVRLCPLQVDLSVIDQFADAPTFLQTAYWGLLGRLPTESESQSWLALAAEPGLFRRKVLCSLLGSAEFSGRHIFVCNIPAYARVPVRAKVLRAMRRLYQALPASVRGGMRDLYHKMKGLIRTK